MPFPISSFKRKKTLNTLLGVDVGGRFRWSSKPPTWGMTSCEVVIL